MRSHFPPFLYIFSVSALFFPLVNFVVYEPAHNDLCILNDLGGNDFEFLLLLSINNFLLLLGLIGFQSLRHPQHEPISDDDFIKGPIKIFNIFIPITYIGKNNINSDNININSNLKNINLLYIENKLTYIL